MLSTNPARRCSTTTALIIGALFAGGLTGATTADAQTRGTLANPTTPPAANVGTLAAPEDDTPDPPAPVSPGSLAGEAPISLSVLTARIEAGVKVNGGPVGWAYSISKSGQIVGGNGGGFARTPNDQNNIPGGLPFGQGTRLQIWSVTKSITAMATVRALDRANIDVDTPVSSYLPAGWAKGPGFAANSAKPVTFRHLLTHTSGVLAAFNDPDVDTSEWGNKWDNIQPLVAHGATPDLASGEQYKNANYALLRVILPRLWQFDGGPAGSVTEGNHGLRYLSYVNSKILAPSGVMETTCWDLNDHANTHTYNKFSLLQGGSPMGYSDETINECGGHIGLFLSSSDLVKITATLRESTKIMSSTARAEMFSGKLGWKMGSNLAGTESAGLWWHGGDGYYGGGREVHTCVMNAPQQYQLSLVMNSQRPGTQSQCRILMDAVNAARTAK